MSPTVLTPEVRAKLLDSLRIGAYQVEAAQFAGIHFNTLGNWLKAGRQDIAEGHPDTPHAILVKDIEEAEAQAVVRGLTVVQRAAALGDWKAAMAWLSRRHASRWGGKIAVSVEAQNLADEVKNLIGKLAGIDGESGEDAPGGDDDPT